MEEPRKQVTLDDIERRHMAGAFAPYYEWLRHLVTLATGTLTVTVTLQGYYVPKAPLLPWALVGAWLCLVLSIGAGLFALRWQYRGPLKAAKSLRLLRARLGDAAAAVHVQQGRDTAPPSSHKWSVRVASTSFALALLALCLFSSWNLLH